MHLMMIFAQLVGGIFRLCADLIAVGTVTQQVIGILDTVKFVSPSGGKKLPGEQRTQQQTDS